jgi:hypothetical protein
VSPAARAVERAHAADHLHEREVIERLRASQDRLTAGITGFGREYAVRLHPRGLVWGLDRDQRRPVGCGVDLRPISYGLLTMIVSLEAIFLSTFVVISQNRQAARTDVRSAPIGSPTKDVFDSDSV